MLTPIEIVDGRNWMAELRAIADVLLDSNLFVSVTIEYPGYVQAENNAGHAYLIGHDDITKLSVSYYDHIKAVMEGENPNEMWTVYRADTDAETARRVFAEILKSV